MAEKRDTNSKGTVELFDAEGNRARVDAGSEAEASFLALGYKAEPEKAEPEKRGPGRPKK